MEEQNTQVVDCSGEHVVQYSLPLVPGPDKVRWNATVNGVNVDFFIDSNAILLDVLRDQAGSLGTKRGCDMGTCGCCSVMINGTPKLSCLVLAQEVKDCEITTVEGLSSGHHLHPIQQTFADCGGSQCGFCTPGFLVVSAALLEKNPSPSEAEIKTAIEGNLCRCTGYQQIVESISKASEILVSGRRVGNSTSSKSDPHPGFSGSE